jgi:sulfur-oxidizing protein SoxX
VSKLWVWLIAMFVGAAQAQAGASLPPLTVVGDSIAHSLTGVPGDPVRGREIVANRQLGLCLLCHTAPVGDARFQGSLAPDLAGAGQRWSIGQLRLRIADSRRLNPETLMPAYHSTEGLQRVAPARASSPILTAQQVEDVVAFLATLRNPPGVRLND